MRIADGTEGRCVWGIAEPSGLRSRTPGARHWGVVATVGAALLLSACTGGRPTPTSAGASSSRPAAVQTPAEQVTGTIQSSEFGQVPDGLPAATEPPAFTGARHAVLLSVGSQALFTLGADGHVRRRAAFPQDVLADIAVGHGLVGLGRSTPVVYGFGDDLTLVSAAPFDRPDGLYVGAAILEISPSRWLFSYSIMGTAAYLRTFDSATGFGEPWQVSDYGADHVNLCRTQNGMVAAGLTDTVVIINPDTGEVAHELEVDGQVGGIVCRDDQVLVASWADGQLSAIDPTTGQLTSVAALGSGTETMHPTPDGFARIRRDRSFEVCHADGWDCEPAGAGPFTHLTGTDALTMAVGGSDLVAVVTWPDGEVAGHRLNDLQPPLVG